MIKPREANEFKLKCWYYWVSQTNCQPSPKIYDPRNGLKPLRLTYLRKSIKRECKQCFQNTRQNYQLMHLGVILAISSSDFLL